MKRSRWVTIGALIFFLIVTLQLVRYSWKKSQARMNSEYEFDTPEAKAARREKDKIMKAEVEDILRKALAQKKAEEKKKR